MDVQVNLGWVTLIHLKSSLGFNLTPVEPSDQGSPDHFDRGFPDLLGTRIPLNRVNTLNDDQNTS